MQRRRALFALALGGALLGCQNGGTTPVIDLGGNDINVSTALAIDPNGSMLTVDRGSGVKADGVDQAMVTVKLVDTMGQPLTGVTVVLAATGGDIVMSQPSVTDARGVAIGALASTRPGAKTVSALANPGPFAVALTQTATVTFSAGAASRLAFTLQPASVAAGAPDPVAVQIVDALGNPVVDATNPISIAILSNPGHATLGGTTSKMATGGAASFADLTLDRVAGGYTLIASTPKLGVAISAAFDVLGGPPAKLAFVAQPPSGIAPGATLVPPIVVAVQDAAGNTIPGATDAVTIALGNNTTGATLAGTVTRTAVNGLATFNDLGVNNAGTYTLVASDSPLPSASSQPFTVGGGPPLTGAHLVFTTQPVTSTAGQSIAVEVQVQDASNQLVTTATNAISLSLFTNPGGGTLSGTTTVKAVGGKSDFTVSVDKAAQGYALVAVANGAVIGVSSSFDVLAGSAARLAFVAQPSDGKPGQALAPPIRIAVEDSAGNVLPSASDTITVAIGNGPAGAKLSGTLTKATSMGVASFADLALDTDGTYTLKASDTGGLTGTVSVTFNISGAAGGGPKLAFSTQPTSTTAGAPVNVTVQVQDANGNLMTGATNAITVALFTNPGSATLGGTRTVTASGGVASFSLSVNRPGSGYSLSATAAGIAVGVSNAFDISVGAATQLAFVVPPSGTQAGSPIAPPVQVAIVDGAGNVVTSASGTVGLTLSNNTTSATLSGTLMQPTSSGVATFGNLSVDKAGSYTLSAAAGSYSGVSPSFTITSGPSVGAAAGLKFSTEPVSITAGGSMTVAVSVVDANGNLVNTASNTISLALVGGNGGGTLSGTTSASASSGVASFTFNINKAGTGYFLVATSPGLDVGDSSSFNVSAGSASQLVFLTQPPSVGVNTTLAPAVQVAVEDSAGNILSSSTASISLAFSAATTAKLGGTTTVAATGGVATFNNLTVDTAGSYALQATSSPLAPATSNPFQIGGGGGGGGGNHLVFSTQPSTTAAGQAIAVTVEVQDGSGSVVTSASPTITISLFTNPGGTGLAGTRTIAAVNGVATFNNLSLTRAASGYSFAATSTGFNVVTSVAFDIVAGPATNISFTGVPSPITAGQTITPSPQVLVIDQFGNPVSTASDTITIALGNNTAGGTLSGTLSSMAMNGVATFAGLSIDKWQFGYDLVATDASLGKTATSNQFNVLGGTATHLAFSTQPSSVTAGSSVNFAASAEDANGNPSGSASGTVSFQLYDSTMTAVGPPITSGLSGGIASQSIYLTKSGSYTITAALSGFTTVTSTSFTVAAGAAYQLAFTVQPVDTQVSTTLPAVKVGVADSYGNVVTGASATIVISSYGGSGALSGTLTQATSAGVATFSDLSLNRSGATYHLSASTSGAPSYYGTSSNVFKILSGTPTQLVFTSGPYSFYAGSTTNVSVSVEDALGNVAVNATSPLVSLAISPPVTLTGTPTNVAPVNGVAQLTVGTNKAGTYTFTATGGTLTQAVSGTFTVYPSSTTAIAFSTQPSNAKAYGSISPTVAVAYVDAYGNPTGCPTVTLQLSASSPAGALSGTSGTCNYPVMQFPQLQLDRAGTGFQLVANDTSGNNYPSVTSSAFNVTAGAWTRIDGGLDGGQITALAIDPKTPANVYAGTTGGGLYKSTNGGTSWSASSNFLGSQNVTALAVHPTTPTTLFAGTDVGLFKSTDSGATWSALKLPTSNASGYYVSSIAIAAAAPSTMYVVSKQDNLVKSSDGGATWSALSSLSGGAYSTAVAADPTDATGKTLYYGNGYIYASIDGGGTGNYSGSSYNGTIAAIVINPTTPSTLYAAGNYYGVVKSTNSAGAWTQQSSGMSNANVQALALSAGTPSTLYAAAAFTGTTASIQLYRSTDSAATWTSVNAGTPLASRPASALAIDPTAGDNVYAGTSGAGVFKSTNGACTSTPTCVSFAAASSGMSAANVTGLVAFYNSTSMKTNLYAAAFGAGIYTSTDGSTWAPTTTQPADVFVKAFAVAPSSSKQLYAAGSINDVYFSADGGATWTAATTAPGGQVSTLAVDPTTATTAYAGVASGYYVYQTLDGGKTWSTISNSTLYNVTSIAVDNTTSNTAYAGTYNGFYVGTYDPVGKSWTWQSSSLGMGFQISALAQGPLAAGDFFAGVSNYGATSGVYHSTKLPNWSETSSTGFAPTALVFDPTVAGKLYSGSANGVRRSTDDGSTWLDAGSGLSNHDVQALAHDPKITDTLFAGTAGAGVWTTTTGGL